MKIKVLKQSTDTKNNKGVFMKTKHTPGPWTIKQQGFPNKMTLLEIASEKIDRPTIICSRNWRNQDLTDEIIANANLIAAAPELLEACETIAQMLDSGELCRDISRDEDRDFAIRMLEFVPKLKKLSDVIAKARGE